MNEEQKAAYKISKDEGKRKNKWWKGAELEPIKKAIKNLKNNDLYIKPRGQKDEIGKQLNALGKAEEKIGVYWNKFKQNMTTDMENHILLLIKLQLKTSYNGTRKYLNPILKKSYW